MTVQLFPEATEEQRLMADSAIRVIEAEYPLTAVREWAERSEPGDEKLWRKLGALGCFRLLAHEDHGGGTLSGNGIADAAILAAERGARLAPGPFTQTSVVAGTLSRAGTTSLHSEVLQALLAGDAAATWILDPPPGDARGPAIVVRAAAADLVVSGTARGVQDAGECDWILVSTGSGGASRQFLLNRAAAGLSLEKTAGLDITRRHFTLVLDDVRIPPAAVLGTSTSADPDRGTLRGGTSARGSSARGSSARGSSARGSSARGSSASGTSASSPALADWQLAVAAVLSAAESVGAMDANFALALAYSKTRIAFGRPIGSFQGLKHLLARTSLALEMAKALVAGAALALGGEEADGLVMASMARAFVSENALELTHNCFQVFGGIGFTWEHDQHLYMRRLASEAYLFGPPFLAPAADLGDGSTRGGGSA